MSVDVRQVPWELCAPQLLEIRTRVFCEEQSCPPELERDGRDSGAIHVLATRDGQPIGTGRLLLPEGKVTRMAVLPAYRGRGIGTRILKLLLEIARHRGLAEVFLHSQQQAIPFYLFQGFTKEGDPFEEAGMPHHRMVRRIS